MFSTTLSKQTALFLLLWAAIGITTGCQSLSLKEDWKLSETFPWKLGDEKPQTPDRLVAYWSESSLSRAGQKPQRGFGGRIYFYSRKEQKPVKVDGRLVVYAFDETNRDPTDNRPTRRYVFPADQMDLHYSKSDIGPSYSFWLPWDDVGGMQKEVSLIARFEPIGGGTIVSPQTRHRLPGTIPPGESPEAQGVRGQARDAKPLQYEARQVGFASAPADGPTAAATAPLQEPRGISTTTISLPRRFGRATPQASPSSLRSSATNNPESRLRPRRRDSGRYQQVPGDTPAPSSPAARQPAVGATTPTGAAATAGQPAAHSSPWSHPAQGTGPAPPGISPPRWPQSPAGSPFAHQGQSWDQSRPHGSGGFSTPAAGAYR